MTNEEVMNSFRVLQQAMADFARVIESAVHDLRDKDQEISTIREQNESLTKDRASLSERLAQAENDLWQARREAREANAARDVAQGKADQLERELSEAKADAVKLREVILNVAAAADSIINPPAKQPEPPKPVEAQTPAPSYGHDPSQWQPEPRF